MESGPGHTNPSLGNGAETNLTTHLQPWDDGHTVKGLIRGPGPYWKDHGLK